MPPAQQLTPEDLRRGWPNVTGSLQLPGLSGPVDVYRDSLGIPHIRAANENDAFFAQGFVTAQDRLWQMEFDRRRAVGRWAEVVGESAAAQDELMRRFRLEDSARADYAAVDHDARAMLDSYAAGVNAFIDSNSPDSLPVEFRIAGFLPEPWQPWDGLAVYKVRHAFMGSFEAKVLRAQMVLQLGPEKTAQVFPGYQPGQPLILPPGQPYDGPLATGLAELTAGLSALNYLNEQDLGSNSWVLSGSRTATGGPILAGDSHRALDTPNVYYQNHVACPAFDVVGLSFPGLPGFPHFGHNPWVAWCVTHTAADYQDLYIERFQESTPGYYLWQNQWRRADARQETVKVKGGPDRSFTTWATHHGPVIAGGPESGAGLALRYTAIQSPVAGGQLPTSFPRKRESTAHGQPAAGAWPATLREMLTAQDAAQLRESMRGWVDPCNNFLFADVHGSIGYLCRGELPMRPPENAWLPVPGWDGNHEWHGVIPFDEMPYALNPSQGWIATANNKPVGDDYPYHIGVDFAPAYRVQRVTQSLLSLDKPTAGDMARVHAESTSIPARRLVELLRGVDVSEPLQAKAKEMLLDWPGNMDAALVAPTIYSATRDALLKRLLDYNLGPRLTALAWDPAGRGQAVFLIRFKNLMDTMMAENDCTLLPPGESWQSLLAAAFNQAVASLQGRLGDDPDGWTWGQVHQARPTHTLSAAFPSLAHLLNPPAIPMSGDGETPLAGAYSPAQFADVVGVSVVRYSYDLSDWNNSLWAVPLGASGHPGHPHYADQSEMWRQINMAPMLYDWNQIAAQHETRQQLLPAPPEKGPS